MTLYLIQILTIFYIFKVKFLPVTDTRNPLVVNNFIEVTDTGVNGLLCYDDVDTKTLEVICRSSSPPQYLMAHRYNTHNLYEGWHDGCCNREVIQIYCHLQVSDTREVLSVMVMNLTFVNVVHHFIVQLSVILEIW